MGNARGSLMGGQRQGAPAGGMLANVRNQALAQKGGAQKPMPPTRGGSIDPRAMPPIGGGGRGPRGPVMTPQGGAPAGKMGQMQQQFAQAQQLRGGPPGGGRPPMGRPPMRGGPMRGGRGMRPPNPSGRRY